MDDDAINRRKQRRKRANKSTSSEEPCLTAHSVLFNHVVLELILGYLLPGMATTLRLVCKEWNTTCCRLMSRFQQSPLTFDKDSEDCSRNSSGFARFLAVMSTSSLGCSPFHHYKFTEDFFETDKRPFQRFLTVCGPTAVSLCLELCDSECWEDDLKFPQLANLRLLEIDYFSDIHGHTDCFSDAPLTFLASLLRSAVGLYEFSAKYGECGHLALGNSKMENEFQKSLIQALPLSVRKLSLKMNVLESTTKALADPKIRITSLQFGYHPTTNMAHISEILLAHSRNIKTLEYLWYSPSDIKLLALPSMEQAETLNLARAEFKLYRDSFRCTFPRLVELDLTQLTSSAPFLEIIRLQTNMICSETVRKLSLPFTMLTDWTTINLVSNAFPCVSRLGAQLHSRSFEDITSLGNQVRNIFANFFRVIELRLNFTCGPTLPAQTRISVVSLLLGGEATTLCNHECIYQAAKKGRRRYSIFNMTGLQRLLMQKDSNLIMETGTDSNIFYNHLLRDIKTIKLIEFRENKENEGLLTDTNT